MRRSIFALVLAACSTLPALAQDERAYIDDRSTAVSVLTSYHNAINRHEYARAWSYWGENHPPNASYDEFVDGYAETERVTLFTGEDMAEGAAGSVYHSVAVAIEALNADGTSQAYAGCFTLRLVQPPIQEPPFEGIHIESADLLPIEGPAGKNVPETCMEDMAEGSD